METLIKDTRYAFRSLLKHPGFAAIAVLTLALGIGANSAMFSTVNAVLLRPLAYPDPDRIVLLEGINPAAGITQSNTSIPDFADWQTQTQAFEQLAGFVSGGSLLTRGDETERVRSSSVTADFFPLFRTVALNGRTLQPADMEKDGAPVVVLSFALWQRHFGGDAKAIGSSVTLAGKSRTIVGVMPAGFDYPAQSELWVPYPFNAAAERRDNRFFSVVARLRQGVPIAQAQAELNTINQRLAQTYVETNSGWTVSVINLQERLVGSMRKSLLVLLGAVAFVLLIACANVANLLLARATGRQKEIALRAALGASRFRVIRQLLTESLLLSVIGGTLGLMISIWLTRLLISLSPPNTPRFEEIKPDVRVFAFTLGLTVITGIIFGLAPALQASRVDLTAGLKESGRTGSGGTRSKRLRSLLMVAEIAFSFMLLVGAGLLIKSFVRLRAVSPGFTPENVLTMRVPLLAGKYPQGPPRVQLLQQILDRVKALPGVQSTGAVLSLPMGGDTFNVGRSYIREGRPMTPEESVNAAYLAATPDYFHTLQIPLVAGRPFDDRDNDQAAKVLIVNETMARALWPGESPLGKRVTIWRDEKFAREIIGVVGDTRAAMDTEAGQQMYVPYAQDSGWGSMSLVVRTSGDPLNVTAAARSEIRSIDKGIPIYNVKTMNDVLMTSVGQQRLSMVLFSVFAAVALLLAMIGIYGVTAYHVSQRTQEIGIRLALGAQVGDIMKLVLKSGLTLAVIGVALGLAGAFGLTRLMTSLLFAVKPTDAMTFVTVAVCVLVTALLACYIPARRATKVDPLIALRYE